MENEKEAKAEVGLPLLSIVTLSSILRHQTNAQRGYDCNSDAYVVINLAKSCRWMVGKEEHLPPGVESLKAHNFDTLVANNTYAQSRNFSCNMVEKNRKAIAQVCLTFLFFLVDELAPGGENDSLADKLNAAIVLNAIASLLVEMTCGMFSFTRYCFGWSARLCAAPEGPESQAQRPESPASKDE